MKYTLYYWPGIPGRGEFVRLLFEDAGVAYADRPPQARYAAFAPPYLKAGRFVIGQTASILHWLAPRLGLAPKDEPARLWLHQQQLTIADWLVEAHDTHHPIAGSLYYEDQKKESLRRAKIFREERLPKYLGFFDATSAKRHSYVQLSLFQMIEGLRYAYPRAMARLEGKFPNVVEAHDRVAARPRLAAYLASTRRRHFNQHGIFRHYPELDR